MSKLVCVKTCFHRGRRWLPGESLEAKDGEMVSKHFAPEGQTPVRPKVSDKAAPVALSQLHKNAAKAVLADPRAEDQSFLD